MGQIQTESPYYQPNPPAPYPFTEPNVDIHDPDFAADCKDGGGSKALSELNGAPCEMAWGLRILDSENVVVFGAGLYSFFNNYDTSCSTVKSGENCQARIFWVGPDKGADGSDADADMLTVEVYNLNTIGTVSMITQGLFDMATWDQNRATFASTLAVFRSEGNIGGR